MPLSNIHEHLHTLHQAMRLVQVGQLFLNLTHRQKHMTAQGHKQVGNLIGWRRFCVLYISAYLSHRCLGKSVRCRGNTKQRLGTSYGAGMWGDYQWWRVIHIWLPLNDWGSDIRTERQCLRWVSDIFAGGVTSSFVSDHPPSHIILFHSILYLTPLICLFVISSSLFLFITLHLPILSNK